MKSIIVYGSRHHGNTKKLVTYLAEKHEIKIVDAETDLKVDLNDYDLIGFASGIDFGRFYDPVMDLAGTLHEGKFVYALYTCAKDNGRYGKQIEELSREKGFKYLGEYGCRGYNTYGPWKLIGGMNKNHPSEDEMERAEKFYEKIEKEVYKDIDK